MRTGFLWFQTVATALGGFLGWYLGGLDSFVYALIIFVVVDYITGVMCAVQDKKLSSKIGSHGIFRKVMTFMLVGIANIVDTQVIGHDSVLRTAVIFFYLSNEGISILENAAHLGLPVPTRLKGILAGMHSEKEDEKEAVLENKEISVPEHDLNTVVDTIRETVRVTVKESMVEAATEIGIFPNELNSVQKTFVGSDHLTDVVDADPSVDLSGEDDMK